MRYLITALLWLFSGILSPSVRRGSSRPASGSGRGGDGGGGGGGGGAYFSGRDSPRSPKSLFCRGEEIDMKMSSVAKCIGVKQSSGTMEGKAFSSTKFHLVVDIADNTAGESMGMESRPFVFGDATEFDKWKHLKAGWPEAGISCACIFDVVAAADGKTKLTLLDIKPQDAKFSPAAPAKAA